MIFVYSLKCNSWKRTEEDILGDCIACPLAGIFINEAIHWLFFNPQLENLNLAFELVEEKFREIVVPSCLIYLNVFGECLDVFGDSLCLVDTKWSNGSY